MLQQQNQVDDQELISRYLSGEESALEVLVNRHKQRVFTYIMMVVKDRELANDLFQDTFFKVVSTLKKGQYNDEGKFLPWVLRIAHNLSIDYFRKEKRMPTVSSTVNEEGEEMSIFDLLHLPEESKEDKLVKKQMQKEVRLLIDSLPAEQKEVLMMRLYYNMSFKEIADSTNSSINTALGRMRYAIINLRKMMAEKELVFVA